MTILNVLWALGWAMIVLPGLVYLPAWAVAAFGVVMIATHNLFDSVESSRWIWFILHSPNFIVNRPEHVVFVAYALVPWVGVTAAGYGLGQGFCRESARRKMFLLRLGAGLTAAFIVLRCVNRYGDPLPWSTQKSAVFTMLSFLNTNKYPPSLLYLLMTLGPALLFLGAVDAGTPSWLRPALFFGKVPMFYYLLHIPLIHLIALIVCYARYGQAQDVYKRQGSTVARPLANFLECRCQDGVHTIARGKVRLDLLLAPRRFKLRHQIGGADYVLAQAAQQFDRPGVDQGNCEDNIIR